MKTFLFLFCTAVFGFTSEYTFSQNARIVIDTDKEVAIDEVFEIIKQQTDYTFIYLSDLFTDFPKVTLKKGNTTVKELLESTMNYGNFQFDFFNENRIILTQKMQVIISGKVTDENGVPLMGVTVMIKGRNKGSATDTEGNFAVSAGPDDILIFTYVGFKTQEIPVGSKLSLNVTMEEDVSALDEVVVVGYGETRKKDLTGTVGTMKSEQIEQIRTQSVDQALVGQISGVYVQSTSGAPGAGARVYIRGLSQIRGDNQPLYIVDGVPIITTPNSESLGLINYGERENPLLAINPNDIERIDVLKDASSAAIYGSRAANGVIMITTKRGKRDTAPSFSFNMRSAIQNNINTYDYLGAEEWKGIIKEQAQKTLDNSPYPEAYWSLIYPNQIQILNDPEYFGNADTDWQDLITRDNALWNEYRFNVNGGTQNVSYNVSLGLSDQDGVMIENNFKRYSISSALDANVTDGFKVGTTINYNYSINKSKGFNSLAVGDFRPDLSPYNDDGSYSTYEGSYGEQYTLLGDGMQTRNKSIAKNLLASVYGEIRIVDQLKFKSQINVGVKNDNIDVFSTSKSSNSLFYGLYYDRPGAQLTVQTNENWVTSFNNTLSYNKTFGGKHTLDAVLGISWDRSRYDADSQNYRGFPDDNILTDINSASYFDSAESESIEQGLNSMFGRINYNYADKYLATFTARRDGSTKFGPDNRYGFFPSGALAWNMHNEDFMKNASFLDQLKLRASLGKTGSDNLPSFTYLAYYQALENNDSFYGGVNGIAVTGVPNSGIHWEETDQLDLGLEFGLFNNRLVGEVVYYEKNTSGIILFVPVTYETGATSWNANVADVSNKGWEISIGGDLFRTDDFVWNSSINLSTLKNNVDNLYSGNAGTQTGIVEGEPIGTIIGYDVVKIAQTQDEIDAMNQTAPGGTYQSTLLAPGDYIFRDVNGDGIINTSDRTSIGDMNPDLFGGWNNTLSYKNWDFTMNWNFVSGIERAYDGISNFYYVDPQANLTTLVHDTWTADNPDAKYARLGSGTNGYTHTSRSVVDASYIRLRSASIGYRFPSRWFANTGVSGASLVLSGNNLITITDYPGLDPEDANTFSFAGRSTGYANDTGLAYPQSRTFTLSVNVKF
ncbi:SusC/RagA family TonB-linked outer membrane protein [Robertkochia solimangrovi]|uniref:SusC/RagA family TonB-linked outer membrane protein n=1 Tax=Robertkochia solimangrovi TaxID=2213046 RepID=UPI0013A5B0C6|nr:TonB-dependent receptor [Robertkochia solimangrovi]